MRTVVFADGGLGCEGLVALLKSQFTVEAVFTLQRAFSQQTGSPSLEEIAAENGIPLFAPDDVNHPLWVERIKAMEPEILFSFSFPGRIGPALLSTAGDRGFRLHGSLLPKYKGLTPVGWALLHGEREIGATLYRMETEPFAGDLASQCSVAVEVSDTSISASRKLGAEVGRMLDEVLPRILDGTCELAPQEQGTQPVFGDIAAHDKSIDWQKSAAEVCDSIRAFGLPLSGAVAHFRQSKLTIWKAAVNGLERPEGVRPGAVVSTSPLVVACGEGAVEIRLAQEAGQMSLGGAQLAEQLNLIPGNHFRSAGASASGGRRRTRVLVLGVNGFIGNALTERLLSDGKYEVHGMDINSDAIERFLDRDDFFFHEGDISINKEWIEYNIKKCDVVLPLVAIATPIEYTRNPLRVFDLDFEENLKIVRDCVKYGKRVVFPSTSEVYGMCDEEEFDEDRSKLVLGPINKQRWIYSCSKQLLDRVIWAYGASEGLRFTLFRPFNWLGPRLDTLDSARVGNSRVVTQLILNLVEGSPILLIDGGEQKRCFTDVGEGIECLFRIIENEQGRCDGQIINVGNPENELSIRELAELLHRLFEAHPLREHFPSFAGFRSIESHTYYGDGYEDVQHRRPNIANARRLLDWKPVIPTAEAVSATLDYFLRDYLSSNRRETAAP